MSLEVRSYTPEDSSANIYYLPIEFVTGDKDSANECIERLMNKYGRTEEQANALVKAITKAEGKGVVYRTTGNGNLMTS